MSITKHSGRQEVIAASVDFALADLTSGTFMPAVAVPAGAIVVGGGVAITTLFDSATTDKFSIGEQEGTDSAASAAYAAVSADITAVPTNVPVVPTGRKFTKPGTVGILWTGAGGSTTTGAGTLTVLYIVAKRAAFSQS